MQVLRRFLKVFCIFAWFTTTAQANLTTASSQTKTVTGVSTIESALSLGITFTINISGEAVMVNDIGHEKVWMNGSTLKDLDDPTARESIARYYIVTVQATGFAEGTNDEQKAAALGSSYSVTPTLTGDRFVAHGATSEMVVGTAGWHTAGIIPTINDIAVTYSSGYQVSSTLVTFYVVVKGGEDNQKDFSGSTNANNITASIGLGNITKNS